MQSEDLNGSGIKEDYSVSSPALVGVSRAIIDLRKTIALFRKSRAHVVIYGETGTGKEIVARQIGTDIESVRPFVSVDSSTILSTTAESILFGHEKGAFTGADKSKSGLFEEAHTGVIYFDEISNMPLEIQAKLLRIVQEREVRRLGSSKVIPLDFRIIAATNRNLDTLSSEGLFKLDLFQRLNVLPMIIPPLRERTEDIELLLNHFRAQVSGLEAPFVFKEEARELLLTYPWPGNVRELSNTVLYILAMSESAEVRVENLPPQFKAYAQRTQVPRLPCRSNNFYQLVKVFERDTLARLVSGSSSNMKTLARDIGMNKAHLYRKLREYGIKPQDRDFSKRQEGR